MQIPKSRKADNHKNLFLDLASEYPLASFSSTFFNFQKYLVCIDYKFCTPSASFLNYSNKASNEDSLISSRYSIAHPTEGRTMTGLSIVLCLTLRVFSLIYSSDLQKAVERDSLRDVFAHSWSKKRFVYQSLFFAFLILSASLCVFKQYECSSSISSLILLIFARVLTAADTQPEVEFEKGSCFVGCELIISHI